MWKFTIILLLLFTVLAISSIVYDLILIPWLLCALLLVGCLFMMLVGLIAGGNWGTLGWRPNWSRLQIFAFYFGILAYLAALFVILSGYGFVSLFPLRPPPDDYRRPPVKNEQQVDKVAPKLDLGKLKIVL